ncbi:hypothetical protein [Methylobacterium haplocladii]|uniref:Uncharacterized protein n=1 Tax=Methylobacterium haplocladii TaxID=1176176 RepID=A0A512ISF0_9HYPH|nr:hypothetical protein [Methylobacterium haplocladii]GEP00642.1 hypothetical protein MHA02_30290 [Methylobacterium haplocladii]GJD85555.1 hypothetical protein HPGCJGGD_3444 [Methylobacterium haplocladii]GLS57790.1 hypothetical protein GCM10007887_04460 [Methylobacterium haplocladii]
MARTFSSIGAFVGFMRGRVATLPAAQRRGLEQASEVVLDEAKRLPGTYQPGWPALQSETVARKATGDSPLLETGAMRDAYARTVVSDHEAAVGSDDPKATWQELGTSRGIPPRPVLKTAAVRKEGEVHRILGEAVFRHLSGATNR